MQFYMVKIFQKVTKNSFFFAFWPVFFSRKIACDTENLVKTGSLLILENQYGRLKEI